ncbi:MAG: TIGR01906 family membrane protein [Hespellia sp.]|nr:TIGR01906 family membrane protein [Hespellia sp.]
MKYLQKLLGILAVLPAILAILITAFQIGAYSDFSFYEKEYIKYQVTEDLHMELADVMDVTDQMMDYLIGRKEELSVITTIDGQKQDFFNEQDRLHMADVKNLFLGGLRVRTWCLAITVLCVVLLWITKADWKQILMKSWLAGLAIYILAAVVIGIAAVQDFTAVFTKFHEIFFTNDLWLFDPTTDYMIRMLPEGFFADMVIRIGSIFLGALTVVTGVCLWVGFRKKEEEISIINK